MARLLIALFILILQLSDNYRMIVCRPYCGRFAVRERWTGVRTPMAHFQASL
jgi:hypothetical protein